MKTCSRCKQEKPLDAFNKQKGGKDGLRSQCKGCQSQYNCQYREANREKIAEKDRKYYKANREKIAERDRKYYKANREKIAERRMRYRESNREEILERKRQYHEANKEANNNLNRENYKNRQEISKAFCTNSGKWTQEEETFLIDNINHMTDLQLALSLERVYSSVVKKIRGLRKEGLIS